MKSSRELENLKTDFDSEVKSKLRQSFSDYQFEMNFSTPMGKKSKATSKSSTKTSSKSKSSNKGKRSRSGTPTRRSPSRSIKKAHKSLTTPSVKLSPINLADVLKKELTESGKRKRVEPHSSKKVKKLSTPSSTTKSVKTPKSESKRPRPSKRVSFKGSDPDLSKSSTSLSSSQSKSAINDSSFWWYCNLM